MIRGSLILLACGVLYAVIAKTVGFGIPCLFHLVTGLQCPGCGISRMCLDLMCLDFHQAFLDNPFLFVTLPFLVFELVFSFVCSWQGKKQPKWNEILLWIYLAALLLFGIVRNLPAFRW